MPELLETGWNGKRNLSGKFFISRPENNFHKQAWKNAKSEGYVTRS